MRVLQGLQPEKVFYYFEEICRIPHTSGNEKEISDYCVAFAQERDLFCRQDEYGNVVIRAAATPGYEAEEPVILQGHLDMVGDKTTDARTDPEKDPLELAVDGDYIYAKGTTLGGDDGIAVAYALAILDSRDIPHPELEVVLTVSEEVGLIGATQLDLSVCRGRRLINVDSEDEGILTAGCSGGRRICCHIPVAFSMTQGMEYTISLKGLKGGHSGMEIDQGRANANILMGRFLLLLRERTDYVLTAFQGGSKENVIAKDVQIQILLDHRREQALMEAAEQFEKETAAEYGTADPDIVIVVSRGEICEKTGTDAESLHKIIDVLNILPDGVQVMSQDLPGLTETSLNLGVAELAEQELQLRISVRSSVPSAKEHICRKVQLLTERLGGDVEYSGDYPAWPYAKESALRDICLKLYREMFGKEMKVVTIHAGLECGILSGKVPGLDCVSIGPDLLDVHTARERASISSVARTWEFLKAILAYKES